MIQGSPYSLKGCRIPRGAKFPVTPVSPRNEAVPQSVPRFTVGLPIQASILSW